MTHDLVRCVSEALVKDGWTGAGPGSWSTSLTNGAVLPVTARLAEEWLRVEARIVEPSSRAPWDLLVEGGTLSGLVRVALAGATDSTSPVRLVADLDLLERDGWSARVAAVSGALAAAASRLHAPDREASEPELAPEPEPRFPESVGAAVGEAGWAFDPHGESAIDVALDDGDSFGTRARALVSGGELHLFVPLAREAGAADPESARARALFLLRTAYRLRAVRPTVRREPGRPGVTVLWEARMPSRAGPAAIDRTLGALAVACRHSVREVRALADPALARHYLSQSGAGSSGPAPLPAA